MQIAVVEPNLWIVLPFVLLLAAIALGPLLQPAWWGRNYTKVALSLAIVPLAYYILALRQWHTISHTAREYISFISLIGSLYIVAGGIHITVKGEATPVRNVVYLTLGAIIANVLGTTGASMLLIRPWLRMNKYRVTGLHVVFFIFIVGNVGGCLTPIGDPPLFLGYLRGIPFWWVAEHCWPMWLTGLAILLTFFFVLDYRNYLRAPQAVRAELAEPPEKWKFEGLGNLFFLIVILGGVFIKNPPFLREGVMLCAALGSYLSTNKSVHESNQFRFEPLHEVAVLFIGIFATMMPALDWLEFNASKLGAPSPGLFFWASGLLSSVLDNAPTYLSFFQAIAGAFAPPDTIQQVQNFIHAPDGASATQNLVNPILRTLHKYYPTQLAAGTLEPEQIQAAFLLADPSHNLYLIAVSVGSVFFGAITYIGNGPNFMIKAIAEHQKVHMPSFLGYIIRYSLPCMFPMLLLVWWLFFSNNRQF